MASDGSAGRKGEESSEHPSFGIVFEFMVSGYRQDGGMVEESSSGIKQLLFPIVYPI